MRTRADPMRIARAVRKGLRDFIGFRVPIVLGRTQRKPQLLTIGNGKGKEKLFELLKGDESKGGGSPGERGKGESAHKTSFRCT